MGQSRGDDSIIKIAGIQQQLAQGRGCHAFALLDQITDHACLARRITAYATIMRASLARTECV